MSRFLQLLEEVAKVVDLDKDNTCKEGLNVEVDEDEVD